MLLGVVSSSRKRDEHRVALHPAHLERIDPGQRESILLEHGYGEYFGVSDAELGHLVGGLRTRDELFAQADILLLPKPLARDLDAMNAGQVLWGWPHLVQDTAMTQTAIDRGLTLIAWEAMNGWRRDGSFGHHVFHKNNEIAGYCSVLHALTLLGRTGDYGRRMRAAVISYGATGRGAVQALSAMGVHDVTVLTQREASQVTSPPASARMVTFTRDPDRPGRVLALDTDDRPQPVAELLGEHDIVVNCILQDTDAPLVFVDEDELGHFTPGALFVDVACDEGMGFSWARPSSFAQPTFPVGDHATGYAVDHSPNYLWDSATWEISEALLPYLGTVLAGTPAWDTDETIRRAIEIRDGVVLNPRILSFQSRAAEHPHPVMT